MADNALRQAFREVLRDPALLLIEVAWRWTFGLISAAVCLAAVFAVLGTVPLDTQRLRFLWMSSPWQAAQSLSFTLLNLGRGFLRVGLLAGLILAICWVCLSAWGRYATLERPALATGATLRVCFGISILRAGITVAAFLAWILAGALAGLLGSVTSRDLLPNPVVMLAIILPAIALVLAGWSFLNWYLSIAPLFPANDWKQSVADTGSLVRRCRDQILEISIAIGLLRTLLFIVAMVLSFATAAVIRNSRILICDLVAISLLYFLIADFLYLCRLVAYARIRDGFPIGSPNPILVSDVSSARISLQIEPN
jgi:hypothetical protein